MELTQKQHNFCVAYVKTGNQLEAYKAAYDAENMKDATIYKRASELMQNGKITGAIASIRDKIEDKAIITVEQRKQLLSRWAWEEETPNALKALDLLNKMESIYVQKQQNEISGSLGVTFHIDLGDESN